VLEVFPCEPEVLVFSLGFGVTGLPETGFPRPTPVPWPGPAPGLTFTCADAPTAKPATNAAINAIFRFICVS
jgi:hypothetical protein